MANYKDFFHYSEKINELIIKDMNANTSLITSQNLDKYLSIIGSKATFYDVICIGNKLKEFIK